MGGMDIDDADVRRAVLEGGSFQYLHHRPDGVASAQVTIQPALVDALIPTPSEQVDRVDADAHDVRASAVDERTENIDQNDPA